MAIEIKVSSADERILYEAIYRHAEHLAALDYGSADSILAARIAAECLPQLGYPVAHWITELSERTC